MIGRGRASGTDLIARALLKRGKAKVAPHWAKGKSFTTSGADEKRRDDDATCRRVVAPDDRRGPGAQIAAAPGVRAYSHVHRGPRWRDRHLPFR